MMSPTDRVWELIKFVTSSLTWSGIFTRKWQRTRATVSAKAYVSRCQPVADGPGSSPIEALTIALLRRLPAWLGLSHEGGPSHARGKAGETAWRLGSAMKLAQRFNLLHQP